MLRGVTWGPAPSRKKLATVAREAEVMAFRRAEDGDRALQINAATVLRAVADARSRGSADPAGAGGAMYRASWLTLWE
eukprot:7028605-Lingulodinium_polyedra.AAC.1